MISRMIERIAAETGWGTHRASFQQLSRQQDKQGIYEAYQARSEPKLKHMSMGSVTSIR